MNFGVFGGSVFGGVGVAPSTQAGFSAALGGVVLSAIADIKAGQFATTLGNVVLVAPAQMTAPATFARTLGGASLQVTASATAGQFAASLGNVTLTATASGGTSCILIAQLGSAALAVHADHSYVTLLTTTVGPATLTTTATVLTSATLVGTLGNASLVASSGVISAASFVALLPEAFLSGVAGFSAVDIVSGGLMAAASGATLSASADAQAARFATTLGNVTVAIGASWATSTAFARTLSGASLTASASAVTASFGTTLPEVTLSAQLNFATSATFTTALQNAAAIIVARSTSASTFTTSLTNVTLGATAFAILGRFATSLTDVQFAASVQVSLQATLSRATASVQTIPPQATGTTSVTLALGYAETFVVAVVPTTPDQPRPGDSWSILLLTLKDRLAGQVSSFTPAHVFTTLERDPWPTKSGPTCAIRPGSPRLDLPQWNGGGAHEAGYIGEVIVRLFDQRISDELGRDDIALLDSGVGLLDRAFEVLESLTSDATENVLLNTGLVQRGLVPRTVTEPSYRKIGGKEDRRWRGIDLVFDVQWQHNYMV